MRNALEIVIVVTVIALSTCEAAHAVSPDPADIGLRPILSDTALGRVDATRE